MASPVSLEHNNIQHSVWVKNWGPLPDIENLPPGVTTINIFEGKINCMNGSWIIDGLNWSEELLGQYLQACHKQNISVKISLGGQGGQAIYNNTWDQLTDSNVEKIGQDLASFCSQNQIDGIDFDYEEQKSDEQRALVGQLIKSFKEANPKLETSVCTSSGNDGTSKYNWEKYLDQIFDAAKMSDGNSSIDRIYVMSYDFPGQTLETDENFMNHWKDFGSAHGIDPAHISIGIDPTDTSFPETSRLVYVAFAKQRSFSTALWDQRDFDEGKYTQQITDEYNKA